MLPLLEFRRVLFRSRDNVIGLFLDDFRCDDAMGCQRDIATKIIEKKADYIVALKGNQGTLREDVAVFIDEQKALKYRDTTISTHETVDADHGRIETRNYTVIHDVAWLQARHQWP